MPVAPWLQVEAAELHEQGPVPPGAHAPLCGGAWGQGRGAQPGAPPCPSQPGREHLLAHLLLCPEPLAPSPRRPGAWAARRRREICIRGRQFISGA